VNKVTVVTVTSIISVIMLCTGIGIVFIPPMVFEALSSYSRVDEILMVQVEETMNSTLMVSTLPTLSSALPILGLFYFFFLVLLLFSSIKHDMHLIHITQQFNPKALEV
jgi:hypothetical protein